MDDEYKNLVHFGGLIRGCPPTLSPTLDDFEIMQYVRQPLRPASNEFKILINVILLQPHEVEIDVLKGSFIEIRAKHERKQNFEGVWMTRNAVYTYELPPEACKKELHAQWSEDNYLLIQTSSSKADEKETIDRVRLVPERVQTRLKPSIELSILKEFMEDIRNRAEDAIQYLRFQAHNTPSPVEKDIRALIEQQSTSGATSKDDSPLEQNSEAA